MKYRPSRLELVGILLGSPVVGFSLGAFAAKVIADISPSLAERVSGHVILGFGLIGLSFGVAICVECIWINRTSPEDSANQEAPHEDTKRDIVMPLIKGYVALCLAILVGLAIKWRVEGGAIMPLIKAAIISLPLMLIAFLLVGIREYVSRRTQKPNQGENWVDQSKRGDVE